MRSDDEQKRTLVPIMREPSRDPKYFQVQIVVIGVEENWGNRTGFLMEFCGFRDVHQALYWIHTNLDKLDLTHP